MITNNDFIIDRFSNRGSWACCLNELFGVDIGYVIRLQVPKVASAALRLALHDTALCCEVTNQNPSFHFASLIDFWRHYKAPGWFEIQPFGRRIYNYMFIIYIKGRPFCYETYHVEFFQCFDDFFQFLIDDSKTFKDTYPI